jgi:DNA repair protein RecO (recombination protein O)
METWGSEGIILKRVDLGEADRLITVFTKTKGKVKALARGVRRVNSRRGPNIELLNHTKIYFSQNRGYHTLQEASVIQTFEPLKGDLKKIALAYRLAEVMDRLFDDQQESRVAFELLERAFRYLDQSKSGLHSKIFTLAFELKILEQAGYRPQLYVCGKCAAPLAARNHLLAPDFGGLLDQSCARASAFTRPVSLEGIKIFRFLLDQNWDQIEKLSLPASSLTEVEQAATFYLEYILEAKLNSSKFLARVESL